MSTVVQNLVAAFRAHHQRKTADPTLLAELAIWSATADGVLDRSELSDLAVMLQKVPGLEAFDATKAVQLAESLSESYRDEQSIAARIAEIALSIETVAARRAGYQLALWAAARDGQFSEEEVAFLRDLQDCLEITDEDAEMLLNATAER